MPHPRPLNLAMRVLLILVAFGVATPALAQTPFSVGPFRSVELHGGGEVILRHGSSQSVRLLEGNRECVSVTIEEGDRLVIEGPHGRCRGDNQMTVEVITPEVEEVMVADGGILRSAGGFSSPKELRGRVENGGVIDIRSIRADVVLAKVRQGGRILTRPESSLRARISQGGNITYWGNPDVQSSIDHGGAVTHGKSGDVDKPLEKIGPGAPQAAPAVPPVPPVGDES